MQKYLINLLNYLVQLLGLHKIGWGITHNCYVNQPASTARRFSKTPEQMICIASIIGCVAVMAGFLASLSWDWPTGPAIVVASAVIFVISQPIARLRIV